MVSRFDLDGSPATRLLRAAARLGCSPSEALALVILAGAAVAGLGLVWWVARPGPLDARADAHPSDHAPVPAHTTGGGAAPPGGLDVRERAIVVHVAGRVRRPGLYELAGGARVAEALEAAGGALPDALLDHVNLARPLKDGEQLRVPGPDDLPAGGPGQPGGPGGGQPAGPSPWRPDGTLDLNLASASDLEELPGIGPVMSERIVAHREEIGGYTTVGQLRDVEGIGEKTFQRLAELVSV